MKMKLLPSFLLIVLASFSSLPAQDALPSAKEDLSLEAIAKKEWAERPQPREEREEEAVQTKSAKDKQVTTRAKKAPTGRKKMTTKSLITTAAVVLFSLGGAASGFGKPSTAGLPRVSFEHVHHGREVHRVGALPPRGVSGVIPRASRGNPLQMFNPAAPAEYGTAAESVVIDPVLSGQLDGIKLLSISL